MVVVIHELSITILDDYSESNIIRLDARSLDACMLCKHTMYAYYTQYYARIICRLTMHTYRACILCMHVYVCI